VDIGADEYSETGTSPAGSPTFIQVPSSSSAGDYTISWGSSDTSNATYVLEESSSEDFSGDIRTAYTGPSLSTTISDKSEGTFYYRVKATKDGYQDSAWRTGAHGCVVDTKAQEFSSSNWVSTFYLAYWNRAGEPEGMDYWAGMIDSGELEATGVAENFAQQPEAKETYPYFNSPETATQEERSEFVQAVYRNLLNLDLPADDEGILYWVNELATGASTPGALIGNIISSALQEAGENWRTIQNKTRVAGYYTESFRETGQEWTKGEHRAQAIEVMQGVGSDPATVTTGKQRVDGILP
jgi:hypothetical protein